MCKINFNVVTTGVSPINAQGRYKKLGTNEPWTEFSVNLNNSQTPDINVNGQYELQVKVQFADLSYSEWTPSSVFKVGNCNALSNLYVAMGIPTDCNVFAPNQYNEVLYCENPNAGSTCFVPNIGDILYKDAGLTIPADSGMYSTYFKHGGCGSIGKYITVNSAGKVTAVSNCIPDEVIPGMP